MERIWLARLRWRLRGAWMWPVFILATLVDAVSLHLLPVSGGDGAALVPGALLAGVINLVAVAVLAPLAAGPLRRRRPTWPRAIAADYAGAGLIGVVTLGVLALGVINRPAVGEESRDLGAQSAAVHLYVARRAPPEYRARLNQSETIRVDTNLYRTCVPGRDPARQLCLIVNTEHGQGGVTLDRSSAPNAQWLGVRSGPGG